MIGQTTGFLEVLGVVKENIKCSIINVKCWRCKEVFIMRSDTFKKDGWKTCGCKRRRMLHHKHRLGITWKTMIDRCTNPNVHGWRSYGGRGINICKRWRYSFQNFLSDMEDTWREGLTIDRINNDRGYYKENCRWATKSEQSYNKRVYKINTPEGPMRVCEASKKFGISKLTLYGRIRRGCSDSQILYKGFLPRKGVAA